MDKPGNKKNLRTCPNGHQYYKSSDCPTCPICEKERKPQDDFLSHLNAPVRRALENEGITTVEKLSQYTQNEILSLHGIGKTSIPILEKLLADKALSFQYKIISLNSKSMNFTKITIEVLIAADIEKVWDYYNSPKHISKWNFASDDWHCPKAENDMKIGGIYFARMEAKDGSFGFDFKAIYDEIIPMAKVAYILEDERKVITAFEKQDDKTKVTTIFDAEGMNPIDMQKAGWQAILNNFKRYTENN